MTRLFSIEILVYTRANIMANRNDKICNGNIYFLNEGILEMIFWLGTNEKKMGDSGPH